MGRMSALSDFHENIRLLSEVKSNICIAAVDRTALFPNLGPYKSLPPMANLYVPWKTTAGRSRPAK